MFFYNYRIVRDYLYKEKFNDFDFKNLCYVSKNEIIYMILHKYLRAFFGTCLSKGLARKYNSTYTHG